MNQDKKESQENVNQEEANPSAAESRGNRPYQSPTLTRFGSLVDLVQSRTGVGPDGGGAPDCTLS